MEWTAYALSRDGVHFHDLIDGDPVYNVEEMSKIEGGAFVDIGVHQDGLVHISQMSAERRVERLG